MQAACEADVRPRGRPAGEVHQALIRAAQAIKLERAQSGQGATLKELAQRSQVGYKVARAMVPKLRALGHLQLSGERAVDYRNRPVAEYLPVEVPVVLPAIDVDETWSQDLSRCLAAWTR